MIKYTIIAISLFFVSLVHSQGIMDEFLKLKDPLLKIEFAQNYSKRGIVSFKTIDAMAHYFFKESGVSGCKNLNLNLTGRYGGDIYLFRKDLKKWKNYFVCIYTPYSMIKTSEN